MTFRSLDHALFQARMWREEANTFNGRLTSTGHGSDWVVRVLGLTKEQCIGRAWTALLAARKFNEMSISDRH